MVEVQSLSVRVGSGFGSYGIFAALA